jgi:hypothetical protein
MAWNFVVSVYLLCFTSNASTLGCFCHSNLQLPYLSHDSGEETTLCRSRIAVSAVHTSNSRFSSSLCLNPVNLEVVNYLSTESSFRNI